MKKKKLALLHSVIALLLCCSMLMGTTFAWFTDSVRSGKNTIVAGNLDVGLEYLAADGNWVAVDANTNVFEENTLWEPGHTEVVYLRVSNLGTLALKYQLGINIAGEIGAINVYDEPFVLSDYIRFGAIEDVETAFAGRDEARAAVQNAQVLSTGYTKNGELLPGDAPKYVAFVVYMPEEVDNNANYKTGTAAPEINLGINLLATQFTSENDSFGNNYDYEAGFPDAEISISGKTDVTVENGVTTAGATIVTGAVTVEAPAGVKVVEGTTALQLSVSEMATTGSNITAAVNEDMLPLDVHVEGVAPDNTTPIKIRFSQYAPIGLNEGNLKLYHVENGATNAMTRVASEADFTAHNQFTYDPVTGDVVLYMATFSEVLGVANTENPWNGTRDYSWYDASKTDLVIANADQLVGLSAIVGGMAGQTQDSFKGKTVKLIANVNIDDLTDEDGRKAEDGSNLMFYPIGYYNSTGSYNKTAGGSVTSGFKTFEGTFDGNGHKVMNFYQNTWEAFGDYNDGYSGTPNHYRDGFGLFGKVYGGTVKNLTVENFKSDGEFTTTGVIAAYADCGATFQNIAIFNCNPRVYNIGNGGIVGCVGWYAKDASADKVTFRNITVDNTNKITALWGSWDVACGGIVGQYYPTSGQEPAVKNAGVHFENCHVAAQIDVYNDVCANYQYYAYRYAGMLIGSVRENETINGHVYPNMDGITASGCTVYYADWNDYYYCELVANSLASYTHDHQMSRLTQVESIDGTSITYLDGSTGTVPNSGRYNYVVVKNKISDGKWNHGDGTDYATCYHFVDGKVWNHADAGKETVDGVEVLKEDKQLIYREFDQLVTGYGWGVTSKGIGDWPGVTVIGRNSGDSFTKFVAQENIPNEFRSGAERTVGKLFKAAAISDSNLEIKNANVQVTVSPKIGTGSTVSGVYTPNTSDWTLGTLSFAGTGKALVTITDYYYCNATTIEIEVVANDVTGILVQTNKNTYDIAKNESFKAEDIVVTAAYADGTQRTLAEGEYVITFDNGDFTTFGTKNGTVSYSYAEKTVTGAFVVYAVKTNEASHGKIADSAIGLNFDWFSVQGGGKGVFGEQIAFVLPVTGIGHKEYANGLNATYYTLWDGNVVNSNAGRVIINNAQLADPIQLSGWVGYDVDFNQFGYYVDGEVSTLCVSEKYGDAEAAVKDNAMAGQYAKRFFFDEIDLKSMNLSDGKHTLTFVSVHEDGIQEMTTWTIYWNANMDAGISGKTANVIILAGQSNAYGLSPYNEGIKTQVEDTDFSNVRIRYRNHSFAVSDTGVVSWNTITETKYEGFDVFMPGIGSQEASMFGPELGIAQYLATERSDEVWYIIKYSAAGSLLNGDWYDGTVERTVTVNGKSTFLMPEMHTYIQESLDAIEAVHGNNINIQALMWMQGESEAGDMSGGWAKDYAGLEQNMVSEIRTKYASYAANDNGENIRFIDAAIAAYKEGTNTWVYANNGTGYTYQGNSFDVTNGVNDQKMDNAAIIWNAVSDDARTNANPGINNSIFFYTYDLTTKADDPAHYDGASMMNLGTRFAEAIFKAAGGTAVREYTVTFNANNGSVSPESVTVNNNEAIILPTPTRSNRTFNGWYTARTGGTKIGDAGATYTPTGNVALYARWN